jgi:hypothetical protein
MKRAVVILLAVILAFLFLSVLCYDWYHIASASAVQRQHDVLAHLHAGESVADVHRLADSYHIAWGQPNWPDTWHLPVGQVWAPFSPCDETYFVDVAFELGHVKTYAPRQSHICM